MRSVLIYFTISILVVLFACTPKIAEELPVEEPKPEEVIETVDNPCTTFSGLTASVREETETAYVLYKDQVKLKNFDKAYKLWKVAYYNAPAANGRIKYQFEDGVTIYKHFYKEASDPQLKSSYVDTVMMIYDKRVECFGEEAYVAGRKAFDYYYYFNAESNTDEVYALFKQSIDAKKEKTDYFVINPFTKILTDKIINEEISLEEGQKYTQLVLDAIDFGNASGKNKEAWEIINNYAPARLENLEGIKGLYPCSYYEKKYMALLESNPDDCETISTVYGRMLWGGCDGTNANVQKVKAIKDDKCYTPPPPVGPLRQAFNAYNEGKYYDAVSLFEDFVNRTDDIKKKAKYTLMISKIYYRDIKNYPKSRTFALKSAEYNPSSGEPYLVIGKLYASSGPLCGPGTGWDSQIVTWPAIDAWQKAVADPDTKAEANKLIRSYKQYMPTKEDVFIRGLKAGDSFKVGCWINRSTTIRTAD